GEGTLMLSADSGAYRGTARVDGGTMVVDGVLGGSLIVGEGGRLEGTGRVGATTNSGVVAPGSGDIGTLTVEGNYVGDDGLVEIASVLGNDNSRTSRLVIEGAT
ncbi:autotransporter outer membrane beta-barrel domain-containing protein, partial [Rhizobiaceae sp. 2RAB30]